MKSRYGSLAGVALSLALPLSAHAQMTGGMVGIGTCTGMYPINGGTIAGTTQLSVGGALIPASFGGAVFNQAECECKSRDIAMHVVLTGRAGQAGSEPTAVMYIGANNCYDQSQRNIETCNQITTTNPPNYGYVLHGSLFQSMSFFDIPIPPEVVASPTSMNDYSACNSNGPQNWTVTVEVGPDTAPDYCQVPIVVNTQGPTTIPANLAATKGDGALTLSWDVPANTASIDSYQVLCRKANQPDQPAMSPDYLANTRYYFSSCINQHLFRRTVGGLNTNNDPATTTDPPIETDKFPIDPRLRCSDRIMANTNNRTTRISGLENGQPYDVMVLAIDSYGNPTPSAIITETPQANAGPLMDYCDGGNCPGFGCAVGRWSSSGKAGAGGALAGLASLLLLLHRRTRVPARRAA